MRICSQYCVISNADQSLEILPALIEFQETIITNVTTCSPELYTEESKKWKQTFPDITEYKDKLISPAFINPHTHIAMNFFRGLSETVSSSKKNMIEDLFFHVEKLLLPDDVRSFARLGAYENLTHGVGLIWDHYYHGEALSKALLDVGLCGVVCPTLQDLSGPGINHWEQTIDQTIKMFDDDRLKRSGVYIALGPHATDSCSRKLWGKIINLSETKKIPIHNHLAQTSDEYQKVMLREGVSPTEFLSQLGYFQRPPSCLSVHNIFLSDSDLQIVANSNQTQLCFCPFSSVIFAIPSDVSSWDEKNIPWMVATDCVASNDSMNIQKELKFLSSLPILSFYHKQKQLPFKDRYETFHNRRQTLWNKTHSFRKSSWLLDKVWTLPGRLHTQFKAGKIETGSLANLIIWDLDDPSIWPSKDLRSLCMGDTSTAIFQMICAGKNIGEEGHYASSIRLSLDYQEALKEAKGRYISLLKRAGFQ